MLLILTMLLACGDKAKETAEESQVEKTESVSEETATQE